MWTENFQTIQAAFTKGRGTRNQIVHIHCTIAKEGSSRKTSTSASLTALKPLTVWTATNRGKFLKRWEYQNTLPVSWQSCMQIKKQQLVPDMEQWTSWKLGKEYASAVYCHSAYLTFMQYVLCEMLDWMNHKLESRLQGEISNTSDMQIIPPYWQKEELKSLLMKVKEESEKGA